MIIHAINCTQNLVHKQVWNPETWLLVRSLSDHNEPVNALVQCGGRLASGGDDGTVKVYIHYTIVYYTMLYYTTITTLVLLRRTIT
jgi:WD40 repeat protein